MEALLTEALDSHSCIVRSFWHHSLQRAEIIRKCIETEEIPSIAMVTSNTGREEPGITVYEVVIRQ